MTESNASLIFKPDDIPCQDRWHTLSADRIYTFTWQFADQMQNFEMLFL